GIPEDISPFATLRILMRATRQTRDQEFHIRLGSALDAFLSGPLPPIGRSWKQVTVVIPDLRQRGSVDLARIRDLHLLAYEPDPVQIQIKSLKFVKGKKNLANMSLTDAAMKARIFGADRAARVAEKRTDHFVLLTDSKAAATSLSQALEKMHDFVTEKLGVEALKSNLPVYVFQRRSDYVDFCVSFAGYDRGHAEGTAGHGSSRYLALVYTKPDDPVVIHELTHAMVQRTLGPHGGSWLQEGFAVYVEMAYRKKDAAKAFSSALRSRNFSPLVVFLSTEKLSKAESKMQDNAAQQLYDQAGAFLVFLKEGPLSDKYEKLVETLTRHYAEPGDHPKIVAKLLGKSLGDVESQWYAWGTKRR
ncbi:MAG: hypothetical protein ACYTFG_19855, partial [Planctomycetota bacterium]